MAMYRVVVRVPDGPEVPAAIRGARTVFGATGEVPAGELRALLAEACVAATEAFTASEGATWECGARFGPRRRPGEQRIYLARRPEDVPTMLAAIQEREG